MDGRIEWEVREEIGILTINNPPENYLYEPEFVALDVLRKWTSDPLLKGILIHGKGKHFSAGGDLKRLFEIVSHDENLEAKVIAGHEVINHLIQTNLPLVTAIHGVCFGGGLEIALACHIRIASENALFAAPEAIHGLIPGMGGTIRLPATVGHTEALKMILTGDMINSEEAYDMKLIDFIVPRKDVLFFAFSMLRRMTKNLSPLVIRSVVETLRNSASMTAEMAIAEETRIFCELAKKEYVRRIAESE